MERKFAVGNSKKKNGTLHLSMLITVTGISLAVSVLYFDIARWTIDQ